VEGVRLSLNFADWKHNELELFETGQEQVGTSFRNKHFVYRGDFDQAHYGRLTGTFGFWGLERNYKATGEEALSPPVEQTGLAIFALEEVDLERAKLQLGARFEHISYSPEQLLGLGHSNEVPAGLPQREFNGVSLGSAVRIGLWADGALVGNFTSSFRAPGLEELYNFGPHVGNLAFEIGNAELGGERSTGFDLSLRHSTDRLQGGANFFLYVIDDFIFGAPTGQTNHGLFEVEYLQRDSRFFGAETNLAFSLYDAVWLNLGMDLVEAELSETGHPLPRIPPLRGYLSLDFRFNGISLSPELKLVSSQDEIFANETPTSGYGLVNLKASCSIPQQHVVHHLSFQIYNLGDKLYRNHLSFIKELAPEMGRGIQASYALKFF
jgi:iron complex outermembrane receptor protein